MDPSVLSPSARRRQEAYNRGIFRPKLPPRATKKLTVKQQRRLRKLGGWGRRTDKMGRVTRVVYPINDMGRLKIGVWEPKQVKQKKKLNTYDKEHSDFLEKIMEREIKGRQKLTKPSKYRSVERRLKNWTDNGKPVQGADI